MEEQKVPFLKKVTPYDKGGEAGVIKFILGNGSQVDVKLADVSEENKQRAMIHGISQRLGDACANLSKDKEYGKAYDELAALADQLATKDWTRERENGTGGQSKEDLIAALVKLKKQPEDVIRAVVDAADDAKKKAWMSNKAIAAEILDIKAKRAKKEAKGNETIDDIDLGIA